MSVVSVEPKKRGRPSGSRNSRPKPVRVQHPTALNLRQTDFPKITPATWNLLVSLLRSLFLGLLRIVGKLQPEAPGATLERTFFRDIPALLHQFIRELAEWWWSNHDRGYLGTTLNCPCCHKAGNLKYKGDVARKIVTVFGTISPRRAYYYCPRCEKGLAPLDQRLGLDEDSFLPTVREVVTWMTSMDPYGKCLEFVTKLLPFSISARSAWLITQRIAADVKRRSDEELAKAFGDPAKLCLPEAEVSPPEVGVLGLDGVMARIGKPSTKENAPAFDPASTPDWLEAEDSVAKPGFKEVKLGLAGHLVPPKKNPTKKRHMRPSLGVRKYAVHLGQPQALFQMLLLLIYRLGLHKAKTILVIADGAHWIWKGVEEHFAALGAEIVEILDYWHAVEHLRALSRAMYGKGTKAAAIWVATQKRHLIKGRQGAFFAALEKAVVQTGPTIRSASAWPGATTQTFGPFSQPIETRDSQSPVAEYLIPSLCDLLSGSWGHKFRAHLTMKKQRSKEGSKSSIRAEKKPTEYETAVETLTYFRNNQSRIQYHEYLSKGYLIGSGATEGACKHLVKERAHRSGMRWGPEGCMSILCNRTLIKSGDWDTFWAEKATRCQSKYARLKDLLGAA